MIDPKGRISAHTYGIIKQYFDDPVRIIQLHFRNGGGVVYGVKKDGVGFGFGSGLDYQEAWDLGWVMPFLSGMREVGPEGIAKAEKLMKAINTGLIEMFELKPDQLPYGNFESDKPKNDGEE